MQFTKNLYRKILAPSIVGAGIERLYLGNNHCLILCYHGVSEKTNKLNNRHLPAAQFEKQLIYLKKHFNILPLYEMFNLNSNKSAKKNIAITFDDGYKNNLNVALPILEKLQIPATFFIATEGLSENDYLMWPDIFDCLKFDTNTTNYCFKDELFIKRGTTLFNEKTNENIYEFVKKMGNERDIELEDFKKKYNSLNLLKNVPDEMYTFLNKSELQKLSQSNIVTIGSHTHKHYNLSNINAELVSEELNVSKKILEDIIQKPVLSIAYPDGSYNNEVKSIAEKVGYKYQLAVSYKEASDIDDDRILPRYSVSNTTTYESNIIQFNRQFGKSGFQNVSKSAE